MCGVGEGFKRKEALEEIQQLDGKEENVPISE